MVSIRDCDSLDTGSTPVLLPKISGSRGMVLSRLHRRQEHVGSNPVFPTTAGIAQRLVHQLAMLGMAVRFCLPAQGNIQQVFQGLDF